VEGGLAMRSQGAGVIGGPQRVLDRFGSVSGTHGVVGEPGSVHRVGGPSFQVFEEMSVQSSGQKRWHRLEQALPDQIVTAGDPISRSGEEQPAQRRVHVRLGVGAGRDEQVEVDPIGAQSHHVEQLTGFLGELRSIRQHGILHGGGNTQLRVTDHLVDEERVSQGGGVNLGRVEIEPPGHRADSLKREGGQVDAKGGRAQVGDDQAQGWGEIDLLGAVRDDQDAAGGADTSSQIPHQAQRGLIRPVNVLDD
jgi:hypothetical protein